MKKAFSFCLFLLIFIAAHSISFGKELPKLAVWDLEGREVKATYARELTSIMVSEISKLEIYEVYSQENIRTLAGWTAEKMKLGCTDTKCLLALGQIDIAKLISGSVGKIGNTYSISLNLFDTQDSKAEKAISEFCRTEDELIQLIQQAVRKLLKAPIEPPPIQEKRKSEETKGKVEEERKKIEAKSEKMEGLGKLRSPKLYQLTGPILESGNSEIVIQRGNEKWGMHVDENTAKNRTYGIGDRVTVLYTMTVLEILHNEAIEITYSRGFPDLKKYRVTGPILDIYENIISIQKGNEKWELDCETLTKITDVIKRGVKVTMVYQLIAREIEVKANAFTR